MKRRFLLAAGMAALFAAGTAMAGTPVQIIDSVDARSVPSVANDATDANNDYTITSRVGAGGSLQRSAASGSVDGTGWSANSITITAGEGAANDYGVFVLDGTDHLAAKIARSLVLTGNGSAGGAMYVHGYNGVLSATEGAFIHDMGRLVLNASASGEGSSGSAGPKILNATQTDFTVNASANNASAIVLTGGGSANAATLGVRSLNFQAGNIALGGNDTYFSAEKESTIGGYRLNEESDYSTARLTLGGNGVVLFKDGAKLATGGSVATRNGSNGILSVGSGKTITLAGGELLADAGVLYIDADRIVVDGPQASIVDALTGAVVFRRADGNANTNVAGTSLTVKSDLVLKGGSPLAVTSYAQSAGTVSSEAGGSLQILGDAAAATISGGAFAAAADFRGGAAFSGKSTLRGSDQIIGIGAGKSLIMGKDTGMDLSGGGLRITGGGQANIAGTVVIGGDASVANTLASDGKIVFEAGSRVNLDPEFAKVITAAATAEASNTLIAAGGADMLEIPLAANENDSFLLGRFVFATDGRYLYVTEADRLGVVLDGTREDYELAAPRISERYGSGVSNGFAANIYRSVVDPTLNPAGNVPPYDKLLAHADIVPDSGSMLEKSYKMNQANFAAFASGGAASEGDSLAALYNGVNNSGVNEVAITTANTVVAKSLNRLKKNEEYRAAIRESVGSDAALASRIINSEFDNRFWLSGIGMWENADATSGLGGYRYDAGGFMTGYDHAFGPVTIGGAFAYVKGDYYDKTALSHDSEIDSYSGVLQASYFAPNGFYATAIGGYTRSNNKVNELRLNAGAASGISWNKADYITDTWSGAAEMGMVIRANECVAITPSVGFTYIHATNRDHSEYLGGVKAGKVTGVSNHAALIPVSLEVGYDIPVGYEAKWTLAVNGGYTHNAANTAIGGHFTPDGFANAAVHKVMGREPGRHNYHAGGAVRFTSDRFDFGVDYSFTARSRYEAHRVVANAGLRF